MRGALAHATHSPTLAHACPRLVWPPPLRRPLLTSSPHPTTRTGPRNCRATREARGQLVDNRERAGAQTPSYALAKHQYNSATTNNTISRKACAHPHAVRVGRPRTNQQNLRETQVSSKYNFNCELRSRGTGRRAGAPGGGRRKVTAVSRPRGEHALKRDIPTRLSRGVGGCTERYAHPVRDPSRRTSTL